MANLAKVRSYMDILESEIGNPQKIGPGTSREEWQHLSTELSKSLTKLNNLFQAQGWSEPSE